MKQLHNCSGINPLIYFHIFILSTFLSFIGSVYGQIYSDDADISDTIRYPVFDGVDPCYIYNVPEDYSGTVTGSLRAVPPGGTPGWDFEWRQYDTILGDFGAPILIESGVPESEVMGLRSGGYSCRIRSSDLDTVLRAWIFINDPDVVVEKDSEGKIKWSRYTCDYIQLNGILLPDTMKYWDISTGEELTFPNGMTFTWTSDNPDVNIPSPSYWLNPRLGTDLPSKDTWFILTAVDSFGLRREDSVFYETIHTKANFSLLFEDEENPGDWIENSERKGEAPLKVRFVNLSENGHEFKWIFTDSAQVGMVNEEITHELEDTVEHTYYIPRFYYPRLISYSEENCVDSFPDIIQGDALIIIEVEPSKLEVMNVFTPNGDGANDYFFVHAKSLRKFRISIYNRWGNLVYQHVQEEEKFDWKGWDGTMDGKGKSPLDPGVYYYVIEALGWDAEKYRNGIYKGSFYLLRDKGDTGF
jgi:gliding motility-associated-like protein